jgi:hypothetical protein
MPASGQDLIYTKNFLANFILLNVEKVGAVTYLGKQSPDGAYLVMKIDTTSGTAFSYATLRNNPTILDYPTAWTNRASLTYGTPAQAV